VKTKQPVKLIFVLLSLLACQAQAQEDPPSIKLATFDPAAARIIQNRPDVVATLRAISQREVLRTRDFRSLGFQDGAVCVTPMATSESAIDLHRSMMVHDEATLGSGDFSLRRTLQKLSTDVAADAPATTPLSIFRQLWDTQAAAPGVNAADPHCSDNNGKINGIPLNRCPRAEAAEAVGTDAVVDARIDGYLPLALVNRLDLADAGWKNCGEHRIVYGKTVGGFAKNLIIFEAVLPNPKPGCRSGCRDVVEFWADLSTDPDPASRADKLETFFYDGITDFRPVVHTSHYSSGVSTVYGGSGSGQIRTNQFLVGDFWTLKEFKTLLTCAGGSCDYDLMPISVKVNPYGVLWNRNVATGGAPPAPPANAFATPIAGLAALAADFQSEVVAQVTPARLGNPDINTFTYEVELDKNSAESQASGATIDNYRTQTNNAPDATFRDSLTAAGAGLMPPLSANQLVNRALAHSCAGCHQPSGFGLTAPNAIGPAMQWPAALSFVHVDTASRTFGAADAFDPAQFGGNADGFNISPALLGTFLPARRTTLATQLNNDVCDCVRKPDRLRPEFLERFKQLQVRLDKQTLRDLEDAQRQAAGRPQTLLRASRNALSKSEARRDAEVREMGVAFQAVSLKPERVELSRQRLDGVALLKAKREAIERIVAAEPPRKSVTGSFRSH
jgi:hypothetical protein